MAILLNLVKSGVQNGYEYLSCTRYESIATRPTSHERHTHHSITPLNGLQPIRYCHTFYSLMYRASVRATQYTRRKDELSVEHGVLIWGARVIVPTKDRDTVLKNYMRHIRA